jgi:glycosyltransferase involved in cell wall biosynthesis
MNTDTSKDTIKFSLVMAIHDQTELLRRELPRLLSQEYDSFEVIVIDEHSTEETADVLEQLKAEHPHLYSTFVPQYHFQRDTRRLAFTIGAKAAKNEWVIFIDAESIPASDTWFSELADNCSEENPLMLAYVKQKTGDIRLTCYDNINDARRIVSKTEHRRKQDKRQWLRGLKHEYDFIIVRSCYVHEILKFFETTKLQRL